MTMHFYSVALRRCDLCSKPATHEIRGSGGSSYGLTCDRCRKKRLSALDKTPNQPAPARRAEAEASALLDEDAGEGARTVNRSRRAEPETP